MADQPLAIDAHTLEPNAIGGGTEPRLGFIACLPEFALWGSTGESPT